jgi:hypothetical protein
MKARDPYRYFTMPFRLCRLVKLGETSPTNPVKPNFQTKKGVHYARSKSFKAFQRTLQGARSIGRKEHTIYVRVQDIYKGGGGGQGSG